MHKIWFKTLLQAVIKRILLCFHKGNIYCRLLNHSSVRLTLFNKCIFRDWMLCVKEFKACVLPVRCLAFSETFCEQSKTWARCCWPGVLDCLSALIMTISLVPFETIPCTCQNQFTPGWAKWQICWTVRLHFPAALACICRQLPWRPQ